MKKLLLAFVLLIAGLSFAQESNAQSNWEVGIRTDFGSGGAFSGNALSIDATVPFNKARIHSSIYIIDRFGIGAYYDWMWALSNGPTGLKFYTGVGPELWFQYVFDFVLAGDLGAEYSFDFPLTVAIDWRPGLQFTHNFDFVHSNWGISARFRIGEGTSFKKSSSR